MDQILARRLLWFEGMHATQLEPPVPLRLAATRPLEQTTRALVDNELSLRMRLLARAEAIGSVELACHELGLSRSTYYRTKKALSRGQEAFFNFVRRIAARSDRARPLINSAVLNATHAHPELGRIRIARMVSQRLGLPVSATRVWHVWAEHGLLKGGEAPSRTACQ